LSETIAAPAPPAAAEPPDPAKARRRRALLVAAFALAAALSRLVVLGERPLHHDESIHAFQSFVLFRDGTFRYDPAYHGPFLYYANALVYRVLGATDTTARLLPALFGIALVGMAWMLVRRLGRKAAFFFALFALTAPHFAYFSRFIREDLYSVVFTFATILLFQRFLETDRARYLTGAAIAFALAGVTKENAYMTGVLFVAYGFWCLLEALLVSGRHGLAAAVKAAWRWTRERLSPVTTAALIFLAIWAAMYSAFGKHPEDWLAIPKAVGYWMGQHAIARIPGPWSYYVPQLLYYETAICLAALFAFPLAAWRRDAFLRTLPPVLFVGFVLAGFTFFTSGNPLSGLPGPLPKEPLPWLGVIWVATIGAWAIFGEKPERSVDAFSRFWAFWAFASMAIYAWAREKVPWLTVHPLLPLTVLAGIGAARLWEMRRRTVAVAGLVAVGLLLTVNTTGLYLACFRYGAQDKERMPRHSEMLAYVQTSEELKRSLEVVYRAKPRVPAGENVVTVLGESAWPLTWYLRDVPTKWAGRLEEASTPVIYMDWRDGNPVEAQLAADYTARRTPIRSWWFPEPIQNTPLYPHGRPTPGDLLRWWLQHEIWSEIGSQDATVFVRRDVDTTTGPLATRKIPVEDTTPDSYAEDADTIAPELEWGGPPQLSEPRGLAADRNGFLYVADTKNGRIAVFDPSGSFVRALGTPGSGDGQLKEPCGVAVDDAGVVWVADTWNHRVVAFGADGTFRRAFGDPDGFLFGPRAIAVWRDGVYVSDTGNKRIVQFDREGRKVREWGGDGRTPGKFVEPVGIAVDATGQIHVADNGNHRVQVFDTGGTYLREFRVQGWKDFYTEPYIAVAATGGVYVTDASSQRVAWYDASGVFKRSWFAAGMTQPTGIAIDPLGRVIVSDRGTSKLSRWLLATLIQ
jgi:uncharacterized protein (TIGR03663 family)